ncbi:MAG: phosphate acyltransferase [Bacteroidota bacterium]
MRIGLDIMGGDYAPEACIDGAVLAQQQLKQGDKLVLYGPRYVIRELLSRRKADPADFDIVHAPEVISMHDHPSKAFSRKKNSSMAQGFRGLVTGEVDGFASAGNTGAMFVGAMQAAKPIPGIIRPAIAACFPALEGNNKLILDVGLNPDSKPDVLYQYAILGSIYYKHIHKVDAPRVGLLNIGREESKGNLVSKSAHEMMKDSHEFNFIGNVEGNELFDHNKVDVVVTDGFAGNVVIKQAESFYSIVKKRNIDDDYFNRFNFENYGGTPILGVDGNVVIGHGISNKNAIASMVLQTEKLIEGRLSSRIKEYFNYE